MADEHLQHLMQLIEAKQVYTSFALLGKIPADTYIPGKQRIFDELQETLRKGKAIHAILQNSRNNGDYPTALTQALRLQEIIPDYPNLKQDIGAIQNALKILSSSITQAKIAASHGRKTEVIKLLQTIRQIDADHEEIATIEKTVQRRAREKSAKSIIISTLIIIIPCLIFGAEKIMIWRAEMNINTAADLIKNNEFKQANKTLNQMQRNLKYVYLFNTVDKNNLITRADVMQQTPVFIHGMQGRVIYDGAFIKQQKMDIIHKLEKMVATGDKLAEKKAWQESLEAYQNALEFMESHQAEIEMDQQVILDKMALVSKGQDNQNKQLATDKCLQAVDLANQAYGENNRSLAKEKYEEAFVFAKDLEENTHCLTSKEMAQYNRLVLDELLEKGDEIKAQDPAEAITFYQQAIEHARLNTMDEGVIKKIETQINHLKQRLFVARVQQLIQDGDALVEEGDFNAGLSKYNFGLTMVEGNSCPAKCKNKLSRILIEKINKTEHKAITVKHTTHLTTIAEQSLRNYFDLTPKEQLQQVTITLRDHDDHLYTYLISAKSVREKIKYELLYQVDDETGKWTIVQ